MAAAYQCMLEKKKIHSIGETKGGLREALEKLHLSHRNEETEWGINGEYGKESTDESSKK